MAGGGGGGGGGGAGGSFSVVVSSVVSGAAYGSYDRTSSLRSHGSHAGSSLGSSHSSGARRPESARHVPPPDVRREAAPGDRDAVDRLHRDLPLRIADPDDGRQVRGEAGEPGVGVIVGRPGLARRRSNERRPGAGAVLHVLLEDLRDHVGLALGHHAAPLRLAPACLGVLAAVAEDDLADRHRTRVHAAPGDRRVAGSEVERRDGDGAEPERRHGQQRRPHSHAPGRGGHVLGADVDRQLREDRVVGADGRVLDRRPAGVGVVVRRHLPRRDVRVRLVVERRRDVVRRRGVDLPHHGSRQHKGLERRAGLPPRLRDEVELVVLAPGGHRRHRANGAVGGVDGDDGGRRVTGLVERLPNGDLCGALEARVDGRIDLQPSRADGVRPVVVDQLVADVTEEVRLADRRVELARTQPEIGAGDGPAELLARDVPVVEHRPQHRVPPRERDVGHDERVVGRRRLGKSGQQRGLTQVQLFRVLREVRLRGGLDAVGAVPEIDGVEPRAQDPLLRPLAVELDCEAGLAQLAPHGPLPRDVEVAYELLGERRPSFDDLTLGEVAPECARDPLVVDAAVPIEAPVLDRDRRPAHPGADLGERDRLPVALGGDRSQRRPVGRIDKAVLADRHRPQDVEVAVRSREADGGDRPCGNGAGAQDQQRSEHYADPARATFPRAHGAYDGDGSPSRDRRNAACGRTATRHLRVRDLEW